MALSHGPVRTLTAAPGDGNSGSPSLTRSTHPGYGALDPARPPHTPPDGDDNPDARPAAGWEERPARSIDLAMWAAVDLAPRPPPAAPRGRRPPAPSGPAAPAAPRQRGTTAAAEQRRPPTRRPRPAGRHSSKDEADSTDDWSPPEAVPEDDSDEWQAPKGCVAPPARHPRKRQAVGGRRALRARIVPPPREVAPPRAYNLRPTACTRLPFMQRGPRPPTDEPSDCESLSSPTSPPRGHGGRRPSSIWAPPEAEAAEEAVEVAAGGASEAEEGEEEGQAGQEESEGEPEGRGAAEMLQEAGELQDEEGEVADAARRAMADAVMDEAEGLGGLESEGEIWLPSPPKRPLNVPRPKPVAPAPPTAPGPTLQYRRGRAGQDGQPPWYTQLFVVLYGLRELGRPSPRKVVCNRAIEVDSRLSREHRCPRAFNSKTPQNSASAIVTKYPEFFVWSQDEVTGRGLYTLAFRFNDFAQARDRYEKWKRCLWAEHWPAQWRQWHEGRRAERRGGTGISGMPPKNEAAVVEVKASNLVEAGRGLFARVGIPANTIIGYYFGVPCFEHEYDRDKDHVGQASEYSIRYKGVVLDATDAAGRPYAPPLLCPFHMLNDHTAWHNVALHEGPEVNQIEVTTLRDIRCGEELYANYGPQVDRQGWRYETRPPDPPPPRRPPPRPPAGRPPAPLSRGATPTSARPAPKPTRTP